MSETQHTVTESKDKIVVKTKLVRGEGTRDQDKIDVKVKGNDPDDVVQKLDETMENLRETADSVRSIQPGEDDDGQ